MVGRHTSFLVTKRSLRNSDSSTGKRPRRVVQTKNVDDTVGLSRREEQELNKALYASLQENRRSKVLPGFGDSISSFISSNISSCSSSTTSIGKGSIKSSRCLQETSSTATTSTVSSCDVGSRVNKSQKVIQTLKHSVLSGRVSPKRLSRHRETASLSLDESSQDSVRSSASSHNGSKRKVHAQRKFAQGCSLPGMTNCTPVKFTTPAVKMLSSRVPKTEDFLTFLCLRGSSILPSHLDFFNFSLEEPVSCKEGSQPASYAEKKLREGASDSSSTSSGANEEVAEAASVTTPTMTSRSGGGSLARRSAARASAGTPETARGIVSLRQGLQRKVSTSSSSSSLTRFPVSSSCLLPASQLTNNPPCQYRNKFYFTPEKSPSPSKTSGIRPGEFTPPSLFSSTAHMSSTYKFSPLVCSPSKFASIEQPFGSPASQSTSSRSSSLSSTSLCGASKRKRQITVPPRTASTKVTCNSGSSFPSFRMAKCTSLDGLVCLSSLTANALSVASSPVASLASSHNSSTSRTPIISSSRSHVNSSQTGNQDSTSIHPSSTTLTPTSSNFKTVNCIHPTCRNKMNSLELPSPYQQPMRTFSKFKHTNHKFSFLRNLKYRRTHLSTPRNCKFRSASYVKYSWKKASHARSIFTDSSCQPRPNSNTPHSNHVPAPSVSACSSNSHCCNLHECSRSNPESLHVCLSPNSKSCMFGYKHVHNESIVQPGLCASDLCLQCQNNILAHEVSSGNNNSYANERAVNTMPNNDSGLSELQDDSTSAHNVSDYDVGRTFSRDVSDIDGHKKSYRGVSVVKQRCHNVYDSDIKRTCHSSDSESDTSRKGDKRVFDFHVNSTFYSGVSDVDNNRTFHKDISDFGVNRTSDKSVSDVDNDRASHKGVFVNVDRTCHRGVSDVHRNRTFYKGVFDDVNRTFCKGVYDVDNNRTFHTGVSDEYRMSDKSISDVNDRTYHKGVFDDVNRAFHKGVSAFDNKTFRKGVSDVDINKTFRKGVSDVDISRTFHRHHFGADRIFHHDVDFNDSSKECRSEDSDGIISSINCDDDDDAETGQHSEVDYKVTNVSDSDREKADFINEDTHENNKDISYFVSRKKHQQHAENKNNSSLLCLRRKTKKNQIKYRDKHRNRHILNERRKEKVERKYRLVKEVPKVKIRIVRKHSVNTCKLPSNIVEKHCNFQESTGESDKKPSGADFQKEFLKMLQADGMPHLTDGNGAAEDIGCRKNVTWPVSGARQDLGKRMWRNVSDHINRQHSDLEYLHDSECTHADSESYSESCSDSIQMNHINRDVSVKPIGPNKKSNIGNADEFFRGFREGRLNEFGKNQSEYVDRQRNNSGLVDYQRNHIKRGDYHKNHNKSGDGDYQRHHIKYGDYHKNHNKCGDGDYQRNHIKHGDYHKNHNECGDGDYQRYQNRCGDGDYQINHSEYRDYHKIHNERGDGDGNCQRNHTEYVDYQKNHNEHADSRIIYTECGRYQKNHAQCGDYPKNPSDHGGDRINHSNHVNCLRSYSNSGSHSESDSQRIQPGLMSNKPDHETLNELSSQDETLSMNSHKEYQQLPENPHDVMWSVTARSMNELMPNVSTKPMKEPINLADSITLRDKVISAFAKFNRKDIIVSGIEVANASSGQPESPVILESNFGAGDKLSTSEPTEKASAGNPLLTLSECCCIDDVCKCGQIKLSQEAIVSNLIKDAVDKSDSGMELLEDASSRQQMLDESIVKDKKLDILSGDTDSTRLDMSATCSQTEANGEIIPDTTVESNSLNEEFQLSEMQNSNALDLMQTSKALDLRKGCLVKQLPFHFKVSSEQNNPADTDYNRANQMEALDLSESGKGSVSTNSNPCIIQEKVNENASTIEESSPTEDEAVCSCLIKDPLSCNRQCMVHSNQQNQTQTTRAEVVDKQIGTDTSTCGTQQVVTTEIETSHSGCKLNNYECNTKSQNTSVSQNRISPLFRHKTAVHLTHGGKKQFKIKMIDVGHHSVKEYEIQQHSANCKCHIHETRKGENISAKHCALKQPINTEQQSLKSHLVISDHIVAQQEQPISSCVSISIQTDNGCSEPKEQNLANRNENTELEVELGSNQGSVKVQVSNCDSNLMDASFCQGQFRSSDEVDSRAFDNFITVEMSDSPQNDKKSQYITHFCCQNNKGIISSKQPDTTRHCCINSQPRGFSSEPQDDKSALETTNLLQKGLTNTNQDQIDGAIIWSSDPRESDNTEINKKTLLSDTSPCCSHSFPSNSSQPQQMMNRICQNVLFAKKDTSSRHRTPELLQQLDCYISGITYFNDGVEKYDPEETIIQEESDDVIMLSNDLKDEKTSSDNNNFTTSSVSPVTNAVSDLVIDLSIHSRSDSNCSRSSSDSSCSRSSSDSWSKCSNSNGSSDNCSISFCDDRIVGTCNSGFPGADILDLAEINGNTTVASNRESVFETVVHKESTSTGLLDLRKITTENLERDFISGSDLTPSSRKVNSQKETAEKTSNISLVCTYSKQKPDYYVNSSEHKNDRLNSASTCIASQPLQNEQDRNKHPNLSLQAKLKRFQKQARESNSLHQRKMSSSQQQGGESTAGENTFIGHQYSEVNFSKDRADTCELVGSQNKGLQSSGCCRGFFEIQGEQLSSENSIILHSYGSLNTGEGFTVVNGKLKQCEILNKNHLRTNSTKCSESCKSSQRHTVVKELVSTAMQHSTAFIRNVARSECGPVKSLDDRNDGPRKQQYNDSPRLEQLPNLISLPDQIRDSSSKQGGVKCHQMDLSFHPLKNIRKDISGFDNSIPNSHSGSLEGDGNMECFNLSQQLEQVQISNCNNHCNAMSKGYMKALKKHVTRSNVSQFVLRPKHKRKLLANVSRNHQGISYRKHPQRELPGPSNKIFSSQKENAVSIPRHSEMTQVIKTRTPRMLSSVAQSSLNNSLVTARSVLNRNRQFVPKLCPSLCMSNSQTKGFPDSVSDRSILRSAYISDLERLKREVSPKSSHKSVYPHTNNPCSSQPSARISLYNPDCIFVSKVGGNHPGAHGKNHKNYLSSSKLTLSGADRQVKDTSLHVLNNGVTTFNSFVSTNIQTHDKQIGETPASTDIGCKLNQALHDSQHVTNSFNSEASVIPATATSSSSSGCSHVGNSPINLSCSGKTQEYYSGEWAAEIPCSISPTSYLINSQEENVLDVIMEELKIQIALLKEEIMRESQQHSDDSQTYKGRGRKNKGFSKVPLRPRGQRGFLLSQRRKSHRYGLQQFDHVFDFSKGNLSTVDGTYRSRDNIEPDLNGLSYSARLPGDESAISGHGAHCQNGNSSSSSSILILDSTPKLTGGLDPLTGHCGRVVSSEDTMLKSSGAVFGCGNGDFTSLSVQTFEASNINLTKVAEEERKDYIEVSSDDEDVPIS